MSQKIILFDIDKTIFDRDKFLADYDLILKNNFNLNDNDFEKIVNLYDEIKDEFGYFAYKKYIKKIYRNFPNLDKKLDYYFQRENIEKYLYKDAEIIYSIKDCRIGIFSKGDYEFQKIKINKFLDKLDGDLIYIFHNKLEKIAEVLEENKDSTLYIIDDVEEVLVQAKKINSNVITIFIDRDDSIKKHSNIDFKISTLSDIIPILK